MCALFHDNFTEVHGSKIPKVVVQEGIGSMERQIRDLQNARRCLRLWRSVRRVYPKLEPNIILQISRIEKCVSPVS